MRTLLAGMWARGGLNGATFLLAVVAVAVAMTGPLYARSSAEHLLDSRMAERLPATLGVTASFPALEPGSPPEGSPGRYSPPDPDRLLALAREQVGNELVSRYWREPRGWLLDPGGTFTHARLDFVTPLYWREGMCDLAEVAGRCPNGPGEALVEARMATTLDVSSGDSLRLSFTERWLEDTATGQVERSREVQRELVVVGTYRVPEPASPAWYEPARFQGDGSLRPPTDPGVTPTAPALLVAKESMVSQTFVGGADRPVDAGEVNLSTMDDVERSFAAYRAEFVSDETAEDFEGVDFASLFAEVRTEQQLLSRVTLAAAVPLVVLALLLLHVLVSAAADVRRAEIALAKLRGLSPRRVLTFAVAEPFLVVALTAPVAVLTAVTGAGVLARVWLGPGATVTVSASAVAAAVAVTLGALLTAGSAVLGTVREPLAAALASPGRRRSSPRWALVLRSAVVVLALAAVVQVWGSRGDDSTTVLELLAPLFVALAVAVGGVALLTVLARWWVARTRVAAGVAAYLSGRRLLRRGDMARLVVPLLLSVSVTAFAVSAAETADDWRVSKARADVGAATVYLAETDPSRLMHLTHRIDPEGRYLAAAVVETARAKESARRVLVDVPRLAETTAWDDSWSERSVEGVEALLRAASPRTAPLRFRGRLLSVNLRDVRLETSLRPPLELWVRYQRGDTGSQATALLGEVRNGSGSVRGFVSGCVRGCELQQVYLTGGGGSITDARGELTLARVLVDGAPVDWGLTEPGLWRAAREFPVSVVEPPVTLEATPRGLVVSVDLADSGIARIAHGRLGAVPPALVTTSTAVAPLPEGAVGVSDGEEVVEGSSLLGVETPMRKVGEVAVLPGAGDEGVLSDLGAALREYGSPNEIVTGTQLWVAAGTPPGVVDRVREAGVPLTAERSVAGELERLRSDAFSLGWRIFLLVGGLTVVLSLLGIMAAAVIQTRWRSYEVAALRVVGVRGRDLVRASLLEYVAILGCSVLLGVVSAAIALTVVLPSISMGESGEYDPAVDYAIRWPLVSGVAGAVFLAVLAIAVVVARRTVRLGRPEALRRAAPG